MLPWNTRAKINCPICGKEMEMMSGSHYYENDLGCVTVECPRCNLVVYEYGFRNGFEDGDANSYWPLMHVLMDRVKGRKKNDAYDQ